MADRTLRRALLIGHGPLPGPRCRQSTFGPQRTLAFAHALRAADTDLRVVLLDPGAPTGRADVGGAWARTLSVHPDDAAHVPLWEGEAPELVVSAGPYAPARVAAERRGAAAWIADVPGDPFAELAAAAAGGPLPPGAAAQAQAIGLRTLAEADHLLVISAPQRLATLGQLALIGRAGANGPPVEVCPISLPALGPDGALAPPAAPRARAPGEPLRVLFGGALNGWQAIDAALGGVERALDAGAPLELHLSGGLGGALAPRQAAALAAFRARRAEDPRVIDHGWLAEAALEALEARCHLGLSLDGPGLEPELGGRTRLLRWTWAGLGLLGTARCALAQALAAAGGLRAVEAEAGAVARALERLAAGAEEPAATVPAAQALLAETAHPDVALAPLRAAARAPARAGPADAPWARLPAALQAAEAELAAIHRSPTWRAAARARSALQRIRPRPARG